MDITRRQLLMGMQAFVGATLVGPRIAQAKSLRRLKFGVGLKSISATVINGVIGEALGYNREEGFTLVAEPLGTNSNVQVATARGDVDIGIGVPSFGLPLLAKHEWAPLINYFEYTYPFKWDVAVLPSSPIRNYAELRGKRIGVSNFGSTEYPVTKEVLKRNGIDPDRDVQWVAVGAGVTAGIALQKGTIDALAYFDTGFGQVEANGIALRFLPRPANIPMIGGQFLMAKKETIAQERQLAVGLARSIAKSSYFIIANPEAGAKVFLEMYPQAAPRGSSQAEAVKAIVTTISRRIKLYAPPYKGAKMGSINVQEFETEARIDGLKIANFHDFYTNALIDEINNFDVAAIQQQAMDYKV